MNKLIRSIQIPITLILLVVVGACALVAGIAALLIGGVAGIFCLAILLLVDTL